MSGQGIDGAEVIGYILDREIYCAACFGEPPAEDDEDTVFIFPSDDAALRHCTDCGLTMIASYVQEGTAQPIEEEPLDPPQEVDDE